MNVGKHLVQTQWVAVRRAGAILLAIAMTGCAALRPAPPEAPIAASVPQDTAKTGTIPDTTTTAARPDATSPPAQPAQPAQPAIAAAPESTPAVPPPAAKLPTPSAPAVTAPKKESPPPGVTKSAPSPLDLKSLEARLKETNAIGVFTKIALKNQVDDLLDQFRAFYRGQLKVTLAELRRPYEMLLQKVLALLQDGDPPLAGAIVASREAIWGILADPAKFATI